MKVKKVTSGYVEQIFENGQCISQKFIAIDDSECINEHGEIILDNNDIYYPFWMIQPNNEKYI